MEIRQIRYVLKLAEEMHFGRAAAAMHIAQSAFSVQISRLERELGVRLFERSSRNVSLTSAGRHFVERARETLRDFDSVAAEVRAMAPERRVLRVGTFGESACELTPYIFETYRNVRPDVELRFTELTMADQLEKLLLGEVDVTIVREPLHDPKIKLTPIFAEPRVAALSTNHRLAQRDLVAVADVIDEPFAVAGPDVPGEWSAFWTLDDVRGCPSRVGAHVRSVGEAFMAVANLGAADTMPTSSARFSLTSGVAFVPIADARPSIVSVGAASGESRSHVLDFVEAAQRARDEHLDVVPGAVSASPVD